MKLSNLLHETDTLLSPKNLYIRVVLDIDVSYEEATFMKETFSKQYNLREISLLPDTENQDSDLSTDRGDVEFESVDQIVTEQITKISSENFKSSLLLDLYRNL
jgi:hypothetical protein